jgi:hypothetical protein
VDDEVRKRLPNFVRAREGEVLKRRLAAMLLRDDVIDGEGELGDVSWDLAILIPVPRSFLDAPFQRLVHGSRFLSGSFEDQDRLGA